MEETLNMFFCQADALEGNAFNYPEGEGHRIIVFLKQREAEAYDEERVHRHLSQRSWGNIQILKAGRLAPAGVLQMKEADPKAHEGAQTAWEVGEASVIFPKE